MSADYIACAFRSPDEAVRAMNMLQSNGISASVIGTPAAARVGCGVSVKIRREDHEKANAWFSGFGTFVGCYNVSVNRGQTAAIRLKP